jgi:hypothetical protein
MSVIALASVKQAPGVTTTAVALAAAWGRDAIVVEADPSGGDIAARIRLPLEPGLLTLAASGRHPGARLDLARHTQPLPAGGSVVVAPAAPELATSALMTVASRLPAAFAEQRGIIDCGRLPPAAMSPSAAGADLLLLLAEPTVAAVEHLRCRVASIGDASQARMAVLLVGDRPYGPADVEAALGVPVLGVVAVDPRGVAAIHAGPGARRSLLVRSARSILDAIDSVIGDQPQVPV